MCYHTKQTKSLRKVEHRFKAKVERPEIFNSNAIYNGFIFPKTPVILNSSPSEIKEISWGLIPSWSKDESIRQYTLNAKIETLTEKPSFKNCINNRCIVIVDGFFEWKWLDTAGKKKQKYLIQLERGVLFSFAGLYSEWTDMSSGEIITTYTLVTTEANELMSEIHNQKKRMPVVLTEQNESDWLEGADISIFKKPEIKLLAEKI
ncbi:MAG: SOS response-associated peptidase [Bacteroidota bacterium]|jgi:putative SOS response-associated peptidase YedK